MSILRHVRQLTNSLGIKLATEGIETAEQESMLTDLGILEHQGFFRGRPMSTEAVLAKLQQLRLDETMALQLAGSRCRGNQYKSRISAD
jgi:EAL domain-containing protein (putative c-di-GMP-specific phosphodiesterase class I)